MLTVKVDRLNVLFCNNIIITLSFIPTLHKNPPLTSNFN